MSISPYDDGLSAAISGMDEFYNPHAGGTETHAQWALGFADGSEIENDGQYQTILENAVALRDSMRNQLQARVQGKVVIVAPPGFTVERWIEIVQGEIGSLTDLLEKAQSALPEA